MIPLLELLITVIALLIASHYGFWYGAGFLLAAAFLQVIGMARECK